MLLLGAALAAEPTPPSEPVVDATGLVGLLPLDVTALGGAGIGFASGANGLFFQPAASANRKVESEGALTTSLAFNRRRLNFARTSDLGNLGTSVERSGVATNIGLAGGWRNAGVGVAVSAVEYQGDHGDLVVAEGHVSVAGAFWDGGLVIGAGSRLLSFGGTVDERLVTYTGAGLEAGFALNDLRPGLNLGTVVRGPVRAERSDVRPALDAEAVAVPWQVSVGLGWYTPRAPRSHPVRLVAEVDIDGPVAGGLSLDSILDGAPRGRGAAFTVTPRLGGEVTVFPERIRLRAGSYLEPARVEGSQARLHGTAGLEVRLFHFDIFGLAGDLSWRAAVDVAPRFVDVGWFGIGFWQRGVVGAGWHHPDDPGGL